MKDFKYIWIAGLIVTALIIAVPIVLFVTHEPGPADNAWAYVSEEVAPTDHSALLKGPFQTGSDVTRACLDCHADAAFELMQTAHWTWTSKPVTVEGRDEPISTGKANLLNNFCIGI